MEVSLGASELLLELFVLGAGGLGELLRRCRREEASRKGQMGWDAAGEQGAVRAARLVARVLDGDGALQESVLAQRPCELRLPRGRLRLAASLHLPFKVLQCARRALPGVVHVT